MGFLETTLEIDAPIEACFDQWVCMECLPQFMRTIQKVDVNPHEIVWHWRITDIAVGQVLTWETVIDTMAENKLISWHSRDGALADTSGALQFTALPENRTRVHVEMMLNPPVPASEFIHDFFGRRIEQILLEDLERYKSTLETQPIHHMPAPLHGAGEVHEQYRNLTPLSIRLHDGRTHEFREDPAL